MGNFGAYFVPILNLFARWRFFWFFLGHNFRAVCSSWLRDQFRDKSFPDFSPVLFLSISWHILWSYFGPVFGPRRFMA
jgi:hypothetical protein